MIGNRLRILREYNGISQKELGEILGVSTSTIGMYEREQREPNDEIKLKICEKLNCSLDFLMGLSNSIRANSQNKKLIPVYNNAIEQKIIGKIEFELKEYEKVENYFALKYDKNDLLPAIEKEDILIIKKTKDISDDKIIVLIIDNKQLVRKVRVKSSGIILSSTSNTDDLAFFDNEQIKNEIEIIGVLRGLTREF